MTRTERAAIITALTVTETQADEWSLLSSRAAVDFVGECDMATVILREMLGLPPRDAQEKAKVRAPRIPEVTQ